MSADPYEEPYEVPTHYPRLLLLISRQTIDREQKTSGYIETIIKGSDMGKPEIVDGADEANVTRREELFAISGMYAHYPQVFLLQNATATPEFIGDSKTVQDKNEKGKFTKNDILWQVMKKKMDEEDEAEENKENEAPVVEEEPAAEAPPTTPDAAANKSGDVPDKNNNEDAAPKSRGLPMTDNDNVGANDSTPKKSKGLFSCFGSRKKKKPNSDGASRSAPTPASSNGGNSNTTDGVFGNKPLKKTTPGGGGAASSTPKKTEPSDGNAGVFGNKPLKKTTPGSAAASNTPQKTEASDGSNTGVFGNKPLKKTEPGTPANAPNKTTADNKASDGNAGVLGNKPLKKTEPPKENNKPATTSPAAAASKKDTSKGGAGLATKGGTKATAATTKVDPSEKHPKGTWYTQTTLQRLCGCCFK